MESTIAYILFLGGSTLLVEISCWSIMSKKILKTLHKSPFVEKNTYYFYFIFFIYYF